MTTPPPDEEPIEDQETAAHIIVTAIARPGTVHEARLAAALAFADEKTVIDAVLKVLPRRGRTVTTLKYTLTAKEAVAIARELSEPRSVKRYSAARQARDLTRMSQTEVSARLAVYLLREQCVTSDVVLSMRGREVTRTYRNSFNLDLFLNTHGGRPDPASTRTVQRYAIRDGQHGIQIVRDRHAAALVAEIGPGSHLIVYAAGAPTEAQEGSREDVSFGHAFASALMRVDIGTDDFLAIAVPRSVRMRRWVLAARANPRITGTGVSFVLVDAAGGVDGLPLLTGFRLPPEND